MSRETAIGWPTTEILCAMRQGTHATLRVAMVVLDDDGDPLESYDGYTSILRFQRDGRAVALTLTPAVVGSAEAQSLTVDVEFETADTATLAPGKLIGDLCVIAPDGERQFPASIVLNLVRATAPAPEVSP